MLEDVEKHFVLPKFTASETGTLSEVIDNDTTTRDKMSLNGLNLTKGQAISVYVMPKTGMEVSEYCTVFNYGPTRS